MAREISIGDKVAIIATAGKRIEERVTLHIPTANFPYSIIDPKAKPGDKIRFEGEVVHVDEETGRVTVQVLGRVTVDPGAVELVVITPVQNLAAQIETTEMQIVGGSSMTMTSANRANHCFGGILRVKSVPAR